VSDDDTSTTTSFELVIIFTSFQPTSLHCYFTFFIN